MYLFRYLDSFPVSLQGGVLTIGSFDGVHQGHQRVLKRVRSLADEYGVPALVMSFEPTPKEFFMQAKAPARIYTWRQRYLALQEQTCDAVLQLKFDQAMADYAAEAFIKDILVDKLKIKHLVIGDDFHFGKNRTGNYALLLEAGQKFGFRVEDTQTLQLDSQRVSSTSIRAALGNGNFDLVEELLGRKYVMSGKVIHGQKLGRTLGFPTLNIPVKRQVSPLHGIYAVKVHGLAEDALPAIASIGTRPVVKGREWLLEVHLIDHQGDYYAQHAEVEFCCFLRSERNFPSLDALQEQMALDLNEAREFFDLQ